MPRRRAFTLIELLVVIAIIAILAAILFPVFSQAKAASKKIVCFSNMKQCGLAQMMYLQDCDGRFPLWLYDQGGFRYSWTDLLQPYAKNRDMWRCPSDEGSAPYNASYANSRDYFRNRHCSYWLNAYVTRWSGNYERGRYYDLQVSMTESEMPFTPTTIVFTDGPSNAGQHTWPDTPETWYDSAENRRSMVRHSGFMNAMFGDSHARTHKKSQLRTTHEDDRASDYVPSLIGLPNDFKKSSNDGANPWWRP